MPGTGKKQHILINALTGQLSATLFFKPLTFNRPVKYQAQKLYGS